MVFLSIGVDCVAIKENCEDVFTKEAKLIEKGIEKHCNLYHINKKYIHHKKATKENCLKGLQWIAKNAKVNDLAVIYIGTHGNNDNQFSFMAVDGVITSEEIIENLKGLKATLILLVDACFAGAIIDDWKSDKVTILAATTKNKIAVSWKFVKPFVEALTLADYNKDGIVDFSEVEDYVIANIHSIWQSPVASKNHLPIPLCKIK